MRRVVAYAVIAGAIGLLSTLLSFFISTFVDISYGGGGGSAVAAGFPLPYFYFIVGGSTQCPLMFSPSFACPLIFHPEYVVGDFALWSVVSFTIIGSYAVRRAQIPLIALGLVLGLAATLLTVFVSPLSIVSTVPAVEALRPFAEHGFPWYFLQSGVRLTLTNAVADYLFWAGVALAAVGLGNSLVNKERLSRHTGLRNPAEAI